MHFNLRTIALLATYGTTLTLAAPAAPGPESAPGVKAASPDTKAASPKGLFDGQGGGNPFGTSGLGIGGGIGGGIGSGIGGGSGVGGLNLPNPFSQQQPDIFTLLSQLSTLLQLLQTYPPQLLLPSIFQTLQQISSSPQLLGGGGSNFPFGGGSNFPFSGGSIGGIGGGAAGGISGLGPQTAGGFGNLGGISGLGPQTAGGFGNLGGISGLGSQPAGGFGLSLPQTFGGFPSFPPTGTGSKDNIKQVNSQSNNIIKGQPQPNLFGTSLLGGQQQQPPPFPGSPQ